MNTEPGLTYVGIAIAEFAENRQAGCACSIEVGDGEPICHLLQARARSSNEIGPRANDSHKLKIATKQLGWRCRVDGAMRHRLFSEGQPNVAQTRRWYRCRAHSPRGQVRQRHLETGLRSLPARLARLV